MATWNLVNADDPALARTAIDATTLAEQPGAYFNASLIADGPLATTGLLQSGHPYVTTGSADFDAISGTVASDAATAYLNFGPLRGPVREFSVSFSWTDSSEATDETVVVIVADGPFANEYPTYSNAGCHLLIHPDFFTYQTRTAAGSAATLRTHTYNKVLAYGEKHVMRLLFDGVDATIITPEGTVVPIPTSANVAAWWGAFGCMEILGAASGTNKVYVDSFSTTASVAAPTASLTTAPRLLGAMETSGADVTTAVTTALSAKVFGLSVPMPPSRRVFITGAVWMQQNVPVVKESSTLAVGVYAAGVSAHGKLTTIYSGFTPANNVVDETLFTNRQGSMAVYELGILIPFSLDLTLSSAFAIGDLQDFQVKLQAGVNDQWDFVDSGGGGGFSGIRRSHMMIWEMPAV